MYRTELKNDIQEYLNFNDIKVTSENRDELQETLYGDMWICDSITGNASGSYTFNRREAEYKVKDELKLVVDACEDFGIDAKTFGEKIRNEEWEYLDVTARCYLLGEVLSEVLDERVQMNEVVQALPESERIIREKLTDALRDNFSTSDWTDIFDFGTTDEIINQLYDSYCDDVFWAEAKVTLSELYDYLDDTSEDEDERDRRFGQIAHSYIFCQYSDLIK